MVTRKFSVIILTANSVVTAYIIYICCLYVLLKVWCLHFDNEVIYFVFYRCSDKPAVFFDVIGYVYKDVIRVKWDCTETLLVEIEVLHMEGSSMRVCFHYSNA